MSLAQKLVEAELSSRKGEQEVFRRLQERNSEVESLRKERASLVARHQEELSLLQTQMSGALKQLETERQQQISLKDCNISELRDVISQLTSDPGMVVDEIRRAYVHGARSPEKLRPPRLTEPNFRPPIQAPSLIPAAVLGQFEYQTLRKIVSAASGSLPGDQDILRAIQTMATQVLLALEDTDSPDTQAECVERVRALLKYVMDAREKCAWGDYVRPSQQHVNGPDISSYSVIDIDRPLSKLEMRELEELSRQQDSMTDPLALKSLMQQLAADCSRRLNEFETQRHEVDRVHIAQFRAYQSAVNEVMATVRASKTARIREEFDTGIRSKESHLVGLRGELSRVLSDITRTMKDVNELQVCKAELENSLAEDERKCASINEEVEANIEQLMVYHHTLQKRKEAVSAVGEMEQTVLSHVQDLLLERGKDLFEGKAPMLMRQFEVLPNVYCQCAIFENL